MTQKKTTKKSAAKKTTKTTFLPGNVTAKIEVEPAEEKTEPVTVEKKTEPKPAPQISKQATEVTVDMEKIYSMLERLTERKKGLFRTSYQMIRARQYLEAMNYFVEALETGNYDVMEKLIVEE